MRQILIFAVFIVAASSAQGVERLPSWNEGPTRSAILAFVERVTTPGEHFVRPEDRIATMDNDGTLWTEKPLYVHFDAVFARMKEQVGADPTLAQREPYRSMATKDLSYFMALYEEAAYASLAGQLFGVAFGGMPHTDYEAWAREFVASYKHPKFGRGVDELIYQPMVELIRYLEENDFTVFISTADEGAFLRLVSERLYGIPPHRVIGTQVRSEFIADKESAQLVRTYRIEHINNWDGKPRRIDSVIGKVPLFAAGNSNGDQHMLQYAALNGGFSLLVHHTDDEREVAYDGHTDKVMPLAESQGWTVVDMKRDWSRVFPGAAD